MDSDLRSSRSSRRASGEDSVEARRYVDALRRRRWLILLLGAAAVVGALLVSSWTPDRYKATASIVKQVTVGPYETVNVDALTRELSTIEKLLLCAHQIVQLIHHFHGLLGAFGRLGHHSGLQVLQHLLELRQQVLGRFART